MAPDGAVEWLCLPRADSASVFATLLDRSAGFFRFGPAHLSVPAQRRYVPGSMVLETTWFTRTGWLIVADALVMGPWTGSARIPGHRRPPNDSAARGMLVRTATCISGQVDLTLDCMPLFDYGRTPGQWTYAGAGYGAAGCRAEGHPPLTLLQQPAPRAGRRPGHGTPSCGSSRRGSRRDPLTAVGEPRPCSGRDGARAQRARAGLVAARPGAG